MDLKNIRTNYKKSNIDFHNLDKDPINFFLKWLEQALESSNNEANACLLSTISVDNTPSSRVVLLKDVSDNNFTFFTNYNSDKSVDIQNNKNVALNFYWPELERQVRIKGKADKIDNIESDTYFQSRPRDSQLGAWLSDQSSSINLDHNYTDLLNELESKFTAKPVPRPKNWGGYCINAYEIEFWQGRPSRFHDRILYKLDKSNWTIKRLAP